MSDAAFSRITACMAAGYTQQQAEMRATVDNAVRKAAHLAAKCEKMCHTVTLARQRQDEEEGKMLAKSSSFIAEQNAQMQENADLQAINASLLADNAILKQHVEYSEVQIGRLMLES